jgi:hypothetical protein
MGEYPPKLVRATETAFGTLLGLSDGREIPIDIGPARLSEALENYERPPLAELLSAQSLCVFADIWEMRAADWDKTSATVLASSVAEAALASAPILWAMFGQPASVVQDLPQRVYGGLDQVLYTSHPFQFRPDPNRSAPWVRGLLSASGGRLFNMWVHVGSGQVEVESDVLMGHFVEGA